jgi:hypothetical protein
MGLILFDAPKYQTLRSSLVAHAIEYEGFRSDLWTALHTTAIDVPSFSADRLTRDCTRFASGLCRANRAIYAKRHAPGEYFGTPALPDGGDVLSVNDLVRSMEAIEHNVTGPAPDSQAERFELDGWGGHPEHAVRIFDPVFTAVVDLYSNLDTTEKKRAPSLA